MKYGRFNTCMKTKLEYNFYNIWTLQTTSITDVGDLTRNSQEASVIVKKGTKAPPLNTTNKIIIVKP